jgi:hypothetical protein
MGSGPRSGKVSWLGSSVVVAALMTACGSAQTSPSVSAHAQASPTPSPASATPTLPPLPPPQPIAPLVGVATSSNAESLYSATGTRTAAFPNNYNPVSPLGDRLLAEHQTALVNGNYGVDALVAMTASGAVTKLETIADPADFIDAIGSEDGTEWAWMLKGPTGGCAGNPPAPTETDVYIGTAPGESKLIAKLPPLKPVGRGWTFHRWTAAGIVLSEGGPPGCYEGPQINPNPTDLLSPTTGSVTPLAAKLGSGDCILQDAADDGTMACIPSGLVVEESTPAPSATVLRIVLPGGAEHNVVAGAFLQGCDVKSDVLFGNVLLSPGPELVSLTRWCQNQNNDGETLIDTWIIDIETLNSVKVSVPGLEATGWLPGTSTLVATGDALEGVGLTNNTSGTFLIAADGSATQLTTADIGMESFVHF